ncbi:fumarylacetoacetate hydrolase family protein [Actibacterium sp. MT2.3-13A]|uniref:fumarylacetoacetate hydrolase family protein n=1 Tax=Actibacterium sp. MT2.3-13A TaxID=2828332 RepID=UPI001BABFE12|nr:fumarylacetoacetate hydrolase family protein [Actibacterium sp. MT2.3-13A]
MTAAQALAEALLRARDGGGPAVPASRGAGLDMAGAYAVQAAVVAELGPVGGWKVACKPGAAQIMAPILARDIHPSGSRIRLPAGAPVGVEMEIGFRLTAPLPAPQDSGFEAAARAATEILPVFEIVASRLEDPQGAPSALKLADNQINGALVLGEAAADWAGFDTSRVRARLAIGGETLLDGAAEVPGGDAFANFCALARMAGTHCGGLRPGQVVITGSLNGLPWRDLPLTAQGEIAQLGAIGVTLE